MSFWTSISKKLMENDENDEKLFFHRFFLTKLNFYKNLLMKIAFYVLQKMYLKESSGEITYLISYGETYLRRLRYINERNNKAFYNKYSIK